MMRLPVALPLAGETAALISMLHVMHILYRTLYASAACACIYTIKAVKMNKEYTNIL